MGIDQAMAGEVKPLGMVALRASLKGLEYTQDSVTFLLHGYRLRKESVGLRPAAEGKEDQDQHDPDQKVKDRFGLIHWEPPF